MFEKTDVRGETAHPLYKELEKQQPFKGFEGLKGKAIESLLKSRSPEFWEDDGVKWNFTKFLVDREGNAVARFEPNVGPEKLGAQIEKYL